VIDETAQRAVDVKQSCNGLEVLPGRTHPGAQHRAMHAGPMMGMVCDMFQRVGVDKALECQQRAGQQNTHHDVLRPGHTTLPKGHGLGGRRGLNSSDDVVNSGFRQQPALDVFLHHTVLIDEDTDRQSEDTVLIGHFVFVIE